MARRPAKIKAMISSRFVRMGARRYSEDEVIGPTVVYPVPLAPETAKIRPFLAFSPYFCRPLSHPQ
jgi:hypothetical protein